MMTNPLGHQGEPESLTAQEDASRLHRQKRWDISRIVLEALATVFSIALLALLSQPSTTLPNQTYLKASTVRSLSKAVTALVISWNAVLFIYMASRRQMRGFHPGIHVGVELILWFLSLASLVLCGLTFIASPKSNTSATLSALFAVLFVLLLILFARSCVEVDRQRKLKHAQQPRMGAPSGQQYEQQHGQQHGHQDGDQPQMAEAPGSLKGVVTKTEGNRHAYPGAVPELQATRDPMDPVEALADTEHRYEMAANEPWMNH